MKIRDRLYGETDDTCAICREHDAKQLTVHHIDSDRANNTYDNQIVLCRRCHTGHHAGKGPTERQIRQRKLHLITRTVTPFGLSALKIASRNGEGVIGLPFLLFHLVDLGYLRKRETQMTYGTIEATARFEITDEGRRILRTWFRP